MWVKAEECSNGCCIFDFLTGLWFNSGVVVTACPNTGQSLSILGVETKGVVYVKDEKCDCSNDCCGPHLKNIFDMTAKEIDEELKLRHVSFNFTEGGLNIRAQRPGCFYKNGNKLDLKPFSAICSDNATLLGFKRYVLSQARFYDLSKT